MTGNPKLNKRQKMLFRQAKKCRKLAGKLRAWKGDYDQNCADHNIWSHLVRMHIRHSFVYELGLTSWMPLTGYTKDYKNDIIVGIRVNGEFISRPVSVEDRCAHDGTPTGAAEWLERHALELEAKVRTHEYCGYHCPLNERQQESTR